MIRLREAILVEGRYDKNTLRQIVDAPVFVSHGFGIFKDPETLELLRRAAETRGLVILTDSDGAGFVIRNHLKGLLPPEKVLHAYIPDIPGKEKRKKAPSKAGLLGVEGMDPAVLMEALRRCGAHIEGEEDRESRDPITRQDLYRLGLMGGENSAARRERIKGHFGLPAQLGTSGFLDALNLFTTREELTEILNDAGEQP